MRRSRWLSDTFTEGWHLRQPSDTALATLARRSDAHVNYVELALDWLFATETECEWAYELIDQHHVKKHHGKQQLDYCRGTRYTGPRQAANKLVTYGDLECRVTGEVCCLHLEWRINGCKPVRRLGIHSPADLLGFDHRAFWKSRLLLYEVDLAKLGRRHRNHFRRYSRAPRAGWTNDDYDVWTGALLLRTVQSETGTRVQDAVDQFRHLDVWRCLRPIHVGHLLPDPHFAPCSL
jgi:hypothetical protein